MKTYILPPRDTETSRYRLLPRAFSVSMALQKLGYGVESMAPEAPRSSVDA